MPNLVAPVDGRRQFSLVDVAVNVGMGRRPFAVFEQVGPDRYVLAGQWPTPRPSQPTSGPSSSGLASSPAPAPKPMTPGRALWPDLP
jgi:hypothetical protein